MPVAQKDYPPNFSGKSRMEYYASLFNSIEINSSFYKLPMASTVKRWSESVPVDFKFTFKLSKTVTHVKGLDYNPFDVIAFMQVISNADAKKGCVLIQFPPGLQNHIHKLEALLILLRSQDANHTWSFAIEFRHLTWYDENVYRLLEKFNVCMVTHDIPASAPPADEYESGIVYLRFHGPGGKYRGSYDDDFLHEYASYINHWEKEGKSVYVYFNNTMGDAIKNVMKLDEYLDYFKF
ncbi:MAG: DUF72 domain-containing protein [Ferruginibacter sp.]